MLAVRDCWQERIKCVHAWSVSVDEKDILFSLDLCKYVYQNRNLANTEVYSMIRYLEFLPYGSNYYLLSEQQKEECNSLLQTLLQLSATFDISVLSNASEQEEETNRAPEAPPANVNTPVEQPLLPAPNPEEVREEPAPRSMREKMLHFWNSITGFLSSIFTSSITATLFRWLFYLLVTAILLFNVFIVISLLRSTAPINTVHCAPSVSVGYRVREWVDETVVHMKEYWRSWREKMKASETPSPVQMNECPVCNLTPCPACPKCPEPVKCAEPVKCPEPVECPEPVTCPEPITCPEPVKCPEPITCPEPVKCPEPSTPVEEVVSKREYEAVVKALEESKQALEEAKRQNAKDLAMCTKQVEKKEEEVERMKREEEEKKKKEEEEEKKRDSELLKEKLEREAPAFMTTSQPKPARTEFMYDSVARCLLNEENRDHLEKGECESDSTYWWIIVILLILRYSSHSFSSVVTISVLSLIWVCSKRSSIPEVTDGYYTSETSVAF